MKPSKQFWDKIADKYARDPVSDPEIYQRKLDITREYLSVDMRVFEFGCGTGSTALYHAPAVAEIDAVDISENMIAIARRKAADQAIDNVNFREGDVETLSSGAEQYDVVMAHSILHLVKNRKHVLDTVYRVLKPGGVFITSTACLSDFSFYIRAAIPVMQLLGKAPYVGYFTQKQLTGELAETGFSIAHQWCPGKNKAAIIIARKDG